MVENLENNLEDGDSEVSIEDAKFNKKDLGSLELRQYYEIVYNILTTKTLLCFAFIKNLFTSNFKTNSEDMSRRVSSTISFFFLNSWYYELAKNLRIIY